MKFNQNGMGRRQFLKLLASVGATSAIGNMTLMSEAFSEGTGSDYKALVCVFLLGGNDSFNMFIPTNNKPLEEFDESDIGESYKAYKLARTDKLAVAYNDLLSGSQNDDLITGENLYKDAGSEENAYTSGFYGLKNDKDIPLGVNALMPELAYLIKQDKASIIANIGNLVVPFKKEDVKDKDKEPLFLFAHNHQQRALQTGQGDNLDDIGWAGKISDEWKRTDNPWVTSLGLNISYAGNSRMLIGDLTSPLVLNPGSLPIFEGMGDTEKVLFKTLNSDSENKFEKLYDGMKDNSVKNFNTLNTSYNKNISYDYKGRYANPNNNEREYSLFDDVAKEEINFDKPLKGSLIKQLESVAKMIKIGATSGENGRQIFFVTMDGFDNHSNLKAGHPRLLRELSLGLWKFQKALEDVKDGSVADKVTTFTMSDFGRSITPNSGNGTDHGWGGHQIVLGGAIKGGEMIGTLPNLKPGSKDDYNDSGRIIPTTAQDQLNATLCKWFGVDDAYISNTLFPNLNNFRDPESNDVTTAYLDLFKTTNTDSA